MLIHQVFSEINNFIVFESVLSVFVFAKKSCISNLPDMVFSFIQRRFGILLVINWTAVKLCISIYASLRLLHVLIFIVLFSVFENDSFEYCFTFAFNDYIEELRLLILLEYNIPVLISFNLDIVGESHECVVSNAWEDHLILKRLHLIFEVLNIAKISDKYILELVFIDGYKVTDSLCFQGVFATRSNVEGNGTIINTITRE